LFKLMTNQRAISLITW